ncbi:MAG: helix-turn-helix transcriptional regulator [Lachnospiraceae bacterium]|jgi:transcriptional regulator with XRE-family HTH domain|nr:helix-turn-helix transcriptional regulator [Lachnospiraceae bacterium]
MEESIRSDQNVHVGANIREARIKRHLGQTQLVRLLQEQGVAISRESLVKIERGTQHIKASQLKAIKEFLGVSYDDLIK